MNIEIENLPVPATRFYTQRGVQLPFDKLEVGTRFRFPLSMYTGTTKSGEKGGMKQLRAWLSQRAAKHQKENPGQKFSVVALDAETYAVGRTA